MQNRNTPKSAHEAAADRATAAFRRDHDMPDGTQVQHWTKVRSAARTDMAAERMNRNLSPLQSRSDGHAETLLTTAGTTDRGTRYTVHEGVDADANLTPAVATYTTEHKFADRHLILGEEQRLARENPSLDARDLAEVAGAQARWKMTGDPGDVSAELAVESGPFADARRSAAPAAGPAVVDGPGPSAQQISQAMVAGNALEAGGISNAPAGPGL
jgi:hypothetical protein